MTAATAHLVALVLGLAWIAFVLLVQRKTNGPSYVWALLYSIAGVLLLAGIGVLPIPSVLMGGGSS